MTKLYRLAHCRAGDKGNTTILSLIAYRQEDFALLREARDGRAVKHHLGHIIKGELVAMSCRMGAAIRRPRRAGASPTSLALDAREELEFRSAGDGDRHSVG